MCELVVGDSTIVLIRKVHRIFMNKDDVEEKLRPYVPLYALGAVALLETACRCVCARVRGSVCAWVRQTRGMFDSQVLG